MLTASKFRIYPTSKQEVLLLKNFGCVRWIYNHCLSLKKSAWENEKRNVTRYELSALIPVLKNTEGTEWLKEVNSQSLQAALMNLDSAFIKFFREKKGFPKFKSKNNRESFTVPQFGKVDGKHVTIPKVGSLVASVSKTITGKVKAITISRTQTGKYFASVLSECNSENPASAVVTESRTIGIDLGLKTFAVLSDGTRIDNPRFFKTSQKHLTRAVKKLSRKKKDSSNRFRQLRKVNLIHERITNRRKDFLHKLTTRLVRDNQTDSFAIEDLAVSNMVKNRNLSRSISDASWREFRRQLEYKSEREGKNVLVIGRFEPSSKSCSCGIVNAGLKLSQRVWTCECGLTHDRDLLAAMNIKKFSLHPQNKSVGRDAPESTLEEIGC